MYFYLNYSLRITSKIIICILACMHLNIMIKGEDKVKDYFLLLLLLIIAYLPASSFIFAIKNDFFTAYYPVRYFITESLNAGFFPIWNPYLNYGFPIYGDMSESYWNPGTWLIAGTVGYNAYSFTLEQFTYIFLGSIGMYRLSSLWLKERYIRLICAVSYLCCGFYIGNFQHFNWITGAGMLPICTYAYFSFLKEGKRIYLLLSIFLFSWLITSVHPGLIIGSIYFFLGSTLFFFFQLKNDRKKIVIRAVSVSVGILVTCLGLIIGYLEIIPMCNRISPVDIYSQKSGAIYPSSWISFLVPFATNKPQSFYLNDIALRNCYFGIFLFCSSISAWFYQPSGIKKFLLWNGIIFMILSSSWAFSVYKYLPLIQYVRLNAEFRLFSLFSLILAGGIHAEEMLKINSFGLTKILKGLRIVILGSLIFAIITIAFTHNSALFADFNGKKLPVKEIIKSFIHSISVYDGIIIQGLVQFLIAGWMIPLIYQQKYSRLFIVIAAEMIIATMLNLPYTGVGVTSPREIQSMIQKGKRGLINPSMKNERQILSEYYPTDFYIGNWAYYSKEIAVENEMYYPLILNETRNYFSLPERPILMGKPFAFFRSAKTGQKINLVTFNYSSFGFLTETTKMDTLVIKQNQIPGWKAFIDGKSVTLIKSFGSLVGVEVPAGNHKINISYSNQKIIFLFLLHMLFMSGMLTWIIVIKYRNRVR